MSKVVNIPNTSTSTDFDPIPEGYRLATFLGLVVCGNIEGKYGSQLRAYLIYEFPLNQEVFKEGDPAKPYNLSKTVYNFNFRSKNFKKYIENKIGHKLSEDQMNDFDLGSYLGKNFVVKISHTESGDKTYANIETIEPLNDQMRTVFNLEPKQTIPPIEETYAWVVGPKEKDYNYNDPDFAKIPHWIRKLIKEQTHEAQSYIKAGNELKIDFDNNNSSSNNNSPKVIMIDNEFTYEQYIEAGYTDEDMVERGLARWAQPQKPVNNGPGPINKKPQPLQNKPEPVNSAPAKANLPETPQIPDVSEKSEIPQKKFVFNDPEMQPHYNAFIEKGWTDEKLVQEGYGKIINL